MRYDKEHKERTRQKLIAEAANAIRSDGPEQLGVASLMARAGLTHGGFYAHFKSRDDLVAKAIAESLDQARRRFEKSMEGRDTRAGLRHYVEFYLSPGHAGQRGIGCPLPALSSDLPRLTGEGRAAFAAGVAGMRARIAGCLEAMGAAPGDAAAGAHSAVAEMVGAVALARAETDPERSATILAYSRQAVLARLGLD